MRETMRMVHHIKCWPQFYELIKSGLKPWELRRNDRNYQVGDWVVIHEYDPITYQFCNHPESYLARQIIYITNGQGVFELSEYVIMTLAPIEKEVLRRYHDVCIRDTNNMYRCPQCQNFHEKGIKPEACRNVELLAKEVIEKDFMLDDAMLKRVIADMAKVGF